MDSCDLREEKDPGPQLFSVDTSLRDTSQNAPRPSLQGDIPSKRNGVSPVLVTFPALQK